MLRYKIHSQDGNVIFLAIMIEAARAHLKGKFTHVQYIVLSSGLVLLNVFCKVNQLMTEMVLKKQSLAAG